MVPLSILAMRTARATLFVRERGPKRASLYKDLFWFLFGTSLCKSYDADAQCASLLPHGKVSLPSTDKGRGAGPVGRGHSTHGLSSCLLPSHRYLTAADFFECHDRQATLKRIVLLEASVAAALGLSMVYSSPALRAKPEYYRCVPLPRCSLCSKE